MKTIKLLLVVAAIVFAGGSCKKDNFDSGPFAISPSDFLRDSKYSSMIVEIAYVDGHQPTNDAVNHLLRFLGDRLHKPKGISIAYTVIPSPRRSSYTLDDIREIEKSYRSKFTKGSRLAAFIFYADAPYAASSDVLGVAYGTTSAAVFESKVEEYSGGLAQPSRFTLEATVTEHEFSHLLGLVDYGTPMAVAHEDGSHPHHCDNQSCLMYYGAETIDIAGSLTGGEVPALDEHCMADLKANGGK